MPPVRPKLSITLPRNFTFHYTDGQDPREQPTNQETEARPPSTRPYRIRPRHRPGIVVTQPGGQSNPALLLQDVPIPTIEVPGTISGPPHNMTEHSPELAEGFLAPAPSRPRFFTPPKTPLSKIFTAFDKGTNEKTQWETNSAHGEDIRRPDSACSGFSDSSDSSSDSLISFPSEGGSCTSPESEDTFAFPGYPTEKRKEPHRTMPMQSGRTNQRIRGRKGHGPKPINWTDETDNHLWKTYTLYRHDPTVTPFFVQPGGVPPLGVCCRVAREAKRSWRGPKLPLSSIEEAGGTSKGPKIKQTLRDVKDEANAVRTADSPDTVTGIKSGSSTPTPSEPQKPASKWPGSESATRRRLRKLCKSKFSPSPHKEQLLRPRSTTPFRQSRATFSSVGWDRGRTTFTRDMTSSLTTSTSATMHPDGSLAQLSRGGQSTKQRNEDWFGRPVDRPVNQQGRSLQFGLGIGGFDSMSPRVRLGSPFDDGIPDHLYPSEVQLKSSEYTSGELKSPFTLTEPLPYTTAVKRRAQHQLEDELSPGGSDTRVNFFEELFGAPAESSHRRVRSRGFSLGDVTRGSRLSSLITPPTMYDQMNSSEFPNTATLQAPVSNEQTGPPPLRLGSPFADDYPSSYRSRAPVQETTPSGLTQLGRQQYINRHSLHSFGFEPPSSIEQRLDEHNRGDRDRDDRDDSSRKRLKG
ncbi:hypothetical protein FGG08_002705 [Glutinoglossum americanum]|uniref:Uncharacterized protein n=1 Tax=Glutinoglossum americanum TaxID=1670608 RepID=A0A9P8L495_9PEZI|nr:hypothetical protein FGG08_002705 [Glutinoglossum americanum]